MAKKLRAIAIGYYETVREIGEEFIVSDDFFLPTWCQEVEANPARTVRGVKKTDDPLA